MAGPPGAYNRGMGEPRTTPRGLAPPRLRTGRIEGEFRAPGSKSIAQRAIVAAGFGGGTILGALPPGGDVDAALGAVSMVEGIVRQLDFARALGRALRRPAFVPTPAFTLRLVFGELADEALLASHRARPARLQSDGYAFRWPDLDTALSDLY